MRINSLLSLFVGILLGALSACGPEVPIFEAKDVSKVDYAQGFSLPDFDGNMKTLADFKGKVVVIFLAIPNVQIFAQLRLASWCKSNHI